jgi:hypothetical protein
VSTGAFASGLLHPITAAAIINPNAINHRFLFIRIL